MGLAMEAARRSGQTVAGRSMGWCIFYIFCYRYTVLRKSKRA